MQKIEVEIQKKTFCFGGGRVVLLTKKSSEILVSLHIGRLHVRLPHVTCDMSNRGL